MIAINTLFFVSVITYASDSYTPSRLIFNLFTGPSDSYSNLDTLSTINKRNNFRDRHPWQINWKKKKCSIIILVKPDYDYEAEDPSRVIRKYPDKPITMAGEVVPSLIRHQFSELVRSRRSSRCNCCKMGNPLNLTNFISGTPASLALAIIAIIQ